MKKRFCKSTVLATIADLARCTEISDFWKDFPGCGPGRLQALYMAASLAKDAAISGKLNKAHYARALAAEAVKLVETYNIDVGNGCAQTRGKSQAFAVAYGQLTALMSLREELGLERGWVVV